MKCIFDNGKFAGKGYINPKSQIIVRLLTRDKETEINEQFFIDKITNAGNTEKKLVIPKIAVLFLEKPMSCRN